MCVWSVSVSAGIHITDSVIKPRNRAFTSKLANLGQYHENVSYFGLFLQIILISSWLNSKGIALISDIFAKSF